MQNQRKYQRIKVYVPVSYDCYDDEGEIFESKIGFALDVSLGGILIETHDIIDANSEKAANGKAKTGLCFHGNDEENINFTTNLIRTHHYGNKVTSATSTV